MLFRGEQNQRLNDPESRKVIEVERGYACSMDDVSEIPCARITISDSLNGSSETAFLGKAETMSVLRMLVTAANHMDLP